jgi:hypothetical protein
MTAGVHKLIGFVLFLTENTVQSCFSYIHRGGKIGPSQSNKIEEESTIKKLKAQSGSRGLCSVSLAPHQPAVAQASTSFILVAMVPTMVLVVAWKIVFSFLPNCPPY